MVILALGAMLMVALAARLVVVALRTARLHREGVRTTGAVHEIWEDTDADGVGTVLRAQVQYELPDGSHRWIHIPARRRSGTLHVVGSPLSIVYDPRHPQKAYVLPEGSRRLLITAGVMTVIAVGLVALAAVLVGVAAADGSSPLSHT